MKKIFNLVLIFIFLIPTFSVPNVVSAQTLADLRKELEDKQNELQENKNKKAETEAEISQANSDIKTIKNTIEQLYVDMANLDKEIEKLNQDIAEKEKEMKDVINFVQVSNGESAYLEYTFGARDFTDFIYRTAVAEQLTKYNETLIDEFNKSIEESKKKQEEMKQRQANMADQQRELENKMALLGEELVNIDSVGMDIEDSIEYQKEVIKLYESKGCKDHENIATCGRKVLPEGTAFYRPTGAGYITSEWGPRDLLGRNWHEGIDVGVGVGTIVYSVANGMVAGVVSYNCGGNMVVIHHNINGRNYTSVYAHLSGVNVSKGQTVDRNTIVGYSGGAAGGYDRCTTGPHLHVTISTGLFWVDYYDWTTDLNITYSINPRSVINFPSGLYNPWDDRLTAY